LERRLAVEPCVTDRVLGAVGWLVALLVLCVVTWVVFPDREPDFFVPEGWWFELAAAAGGAQSNAAAHSTTTRRVIRTIMGASGDVGEPRV